MNFHGKEITQILLNGKEFFADSKVALNNMPVDALKEVKVYEQQSDKEQMTGVSDGKKKTVMDVKTKKDLTDGLMGDVSALKGSGDMYGAKMSLNKFVGKWRMSLYGDLGKLPRYGNFISDMADNPAQMKDIGFSLGTEIKKLNLNVSASYNNNKSADESRSQSEEYLPNGSQYAYNNGLSTGRNSSFWENIYMTGSLSDRTEINFRHNINHSRLNSVSENISATFSTNPLDYVSEPWRDDAMIPPEFRINKNTGNSQNKTNNLMIGNNLLITHKLNDIGRKLSIELRNDYSNQASGNYQQSSITYYQLKNDLGADSVLYRNQYRESPARNLLLAGEVSYTEPIGKQMLQCRYGLCPVAGREFQENGPQADEGRTGRTRPARFRGGQEGYRGQGVRTRSRPGELQVGFDGAGFVQYQFRRRAGRQGRRAGGFRHPRERPQRPWRRNGLGQHLGLQAERGQEGEHPSDFVLTEDALYGCKGGG